MGKQVRKLYGIVSSIDEKKIYLGGHNDTYEKLQKIKKNKEDNTPFTCEGNKFYVIINNMSVPEHIIGEKVIIWAYIKKYRFTSSQNHNKGDLVSGWNIYATKIEKNDDWS